MSEPPRKYPGVVSVSEPWLMRGHGTPQRPTLEEARQQHADRVRWYWQEAIDWQAYLDARAALAALTDPLSRALLDLHSIGHPDTRPTCEGCDVEGYEAEEPFWPCRTVQAVAAHHDIPLPDVALWLSPPAAEPPVYVSPEDWEPPKSPWEQMKAAAPALFDLLLCPCSEVPPKPGVHFGGLTVDPGCPIHGGGS